MTLFAHTTVYEGLSLLPHWLSHYRRTGADVLLISAGDRRGRAVFDEAKAMCRGLPAIVLPFRYQKQHNRDNLAMRPKLLREAGARQDDWIMYADLDEFYSFGMRTPELLASMEEQGAVALAGKIIDRVASDGSLPPVRPDINLGEQYPVGCTLTKRFFRAAVRKITLCRVAVRVNGAQSVIQSGAKPVWLPCTAHHFRWTDGLIERAKRRLNGRHYRRGYRNELKSLLAYWQEHGRLPVDDGRANAQMLGPLTYFE